MVSPRDSAFSFCDSTSTATSEGWLACSLQSGEIERAHALVIAWSLAEPERMGEVALLARRAGPPQILGRGAALPDDDAPRLRFSRHRGHRMEPRPPLAAPGLSRRQLLLVPSASGIAFERTGRCTTLLNGRPVDSGLLRPGDTLTLHKQLVLLCLPRPAILPAPHDGESLLFGSADRDGIVGESEAAWRLREQVALAARSGAHVLVLGESGSGKELAARAVHRLSPRSGRPFVARSAAAIPAGLLDAELFGNRRDYPNAGMPEREGVVGAAHGGTLFLDEIGELSPDLQAHLLRLLDSGGEYHRLGDATSRRSDFRLIAATNRSPADLKHDFAARFPIRITVPGLADRREDVPLLARHLLREIATAAPELQHRFFEVGASGEPLARLDPAFIEALVTWPWSTHARELRALLWASVRASRGHYLTTPPEMETRATLVEEGIEEGDADDGGGPSARAIREALAQHGGSAAKTCEALGLPNRFALYRLMRKRGIEPGRVDSKK